VIGTLQRILDDQHGPLVYINRQMVAVILRRYQKLEEDTGDVDREIEMANEKRKLELIREERNAMLDDIEQVKLHSQYRDIKLQLQDATLILGQLRQTIEEYWEKLQRAQVELNILSKNKRRLQNAVETLQSILRSSLL